MTSTTGITNHRLFAPANNGNIRIHTQFASAMQKKADESGYRLLLCNTNGDLEKEKSALSMLASMNVTLITIDNVE